MPTLGTSSIKRTMSHGRKRRTMSTGSVNLLVEARATIGMAACTDTVSSQWQTPLKLEKYQFLEWMLRVILRKFLSTRQLQILCQTSLWQNSNPIRVSFLARTSGTRSSSSSPRDKTLNLPGGPRFSWTLMDGVQAVVGVPF